MGFDGVVLSWGPPRMGTTWLFNVLRAIAEKAEVSLAVVADDVPLPDKHWPGPVIIKSHQADPPELLEAHREDIALAAFVILRDAERAYASLLRTQQESGSTLISWLQRDLASFEAALPTLNNVVVLREEWIANESDRLIEKVAGLLGWNLTNEGVQDISAHFSKEAVRSRVEALAQTQDWEQDFRHFDRDTQWHAGHISGSSDLVLQLDPEIKGELEFLQARIDKLTERFSIWRTDNFSETLATSPAMVFVTNRANSSTSRLFPGTWRSRVFTFARRML